ncbi:cytidine deaminase-like protein [Myriangium duriaei CBS 260.36]|uniref:Cytidine deaminase-like protein n=1 Tax=Myriangium duriaei CBS 260.36 TaxID=1168546 RepID=A0A9P4IZH0_9PEZI|nr:cytidine deaminase-like protein [Myriangium duriaei CBS 260.36]
MSADEIGYQIALQEARDSMAVGGQPIGSSIVDTDGNVIGKGHNMVMQTGSPIFHAETSAFHSVLHKPRSIFEGTTLYTTLSPCSMCTGAIIFFKVKKVVIGENYHMSGREDFLRQHGIEVVVLGHKPTQELLASYIENHEVDW